MRPFVSGLTQRADGSYGALGEYLPVAPYSGFGRFRNLKLSVGGLALCTACRMENPRGLKLACQTFKKDVAKLSCCAA